MFRAIAIKELRETWWIGVLPAVLLLLLVAGGMGLEFVEYPPFLVMREKLQPGWIPEVPFLNESWPGAVLTLGSVAAVVMGLWQTMGESAQGTWSFLLFRPAHRTSLIVGKLAAGLTWLLMCLIVPILIYGCWAATAGRRWTPFEWWMTGPTIRAWAYLSVAYLAAFLCGLRPARWWVSRFFPAVFACFAWIPIVALPWAAWPQWLLIGVADIALFGAILYVTESRDWI